MDSQAVFVASNFTGPDPPGACKRYSAKDKAYVDVACPRSVLDYNKTMGGVDLFNQSTKNYAISVRLKKWYWAVYAWFLNVQMVQAWRLYRNTWKQRHEEDKEEEKTKDGEFEEHLAASGLPRTVKEQKRRDREEEKKKVKREQKKVEEMPLLEFLLQAVELLMANHSDHKRKERMPHREVARLSTSNQQAVRFDHTKPHFVISSQVKGVCQSCKGRSSFRCQTCGVALHPDCFIGYHTLPEK